MAKQAGCQFLPSFTLKSKMNEKFCLSAANWMIETQQVILNLSARDDGRFEAGKFHLFCASTARTPAVSAATRIGNGKSEGASIV